MYVVCIKIILLGRWSSRAIMLLTLQTVFNIQEDGFVTCFLTGAGGSFLPTALSFVRRC